MGTLSVFTGGALATNACLLPSEKGVLCFDAPQDLAEELRWRNLKVEALILTHGHFDHIWDAAEIQREHGCPVWIHAADAPMVRDTRVFRAFGIAMEVAPVSDLQLLPVSLKGVAVWSCGGKTFQLAHIPGHSQGSVTFYDQEEGLVIGGDVLFAGGVGRWDLPGGNHDDLIEGIRKHLLPLPEATVVYPGHGPETTIGVEKTTNTYLI